LGISRKDKLYITKHGEPHTTEGIPDCCLASDWSTTDDGHESELQELLKVPRKPPIRKLPRRQ